MASPKKLPALDEIRKELREVRRERTDLKAEIVDLRGKCARFEQRLVKVEVAVGRAGSGEMPPNVEREDTRENYRGEDEQEGG